MIGVSLIAKRPDFTRDAFRDYYEEKHSRLGIRYFKFQKYLRNHVVSSSPGVSFDVVMQCVMAPDFDPAATNFDPAVRAIFDEDERAFMVPEDIRSGALDERVLSGPVVDIAPAGARRQMIFIRKAGDTDAGPFEASLEAYGLSLAQNASVGTVTAATAKPGMAGYAAFPYDAMVSLWLKEGQPAVDPLPETPDFEIAAWVLTEVCEDRPETLAAAFGQR